jgi:hypothetical protein
MKVFISWSGDRSRAVAEALRDWLPKVIQAVHPWMSAVDIDRGARWFTEISSELEQTRFGIICLTPENTTAPWLYFEAGALSKTLEKSHVCPYLFGLEPAELTGPLVQFNAAKSDREQTRQLIQTINGALQTPLAQETIDESFDVWWPKLNDRLAGIPSRQAPAASKRPLPDMVEEILELVRAQSRMRPGGLAEADYLVRDVIDEMRNRKNVIAVDHAEELRKAVQRKFSTAKAQVIPLHSLVTHPKNGEGIVISRIKKANDVLLIVDFKEKGRVPMLQSEADLTVIGGIEDLEPEEEA